MSAALGIMVLVLYVSTAALYAAFFVRQEQRLKPYTSALLLVSLAAHALYLTLLALALDRLLLGRLFEVLGSAAFLFALSYLLLEHQIRDKSMGVLIVPIVAIFHGISLLGVSPHQAVLKPPLTMLSYQAHVIFMLLAYCGFFIACIAGSLYLLLARELHRKRLGFFFSRLPSLELMDRLNTLAAALGFCCATVGMGLGSYMAWQYWGNPFPLDPKFYCFFLTWIIYCAQLFTRSRLGWHGERAAWFSIAGFLWILATYFIVSFFYTKLHAYY